MKETDEHVVLLIHRNWPRPPLPIYVTSAISSCLGGTPPSTRKNQDHSLSQIPQASPRKCFDGRARSPTKSTLARGDDEVRIGPREALFSVADRVLQPGYETSRPASKEHTKAVVSSQGHGFSRCTARDIVCRISKSRGGNNGPRGANADTKKQASQPARDH